MCYKTYNGIHLINVVSSLTDFKKHVIKRSKLYIKFSISRGESKYYKEKPKNNFLKLGTV